MCKVLAYPLHVIEKVLMNLWGVGPEDEEGTTWVAAAAEWLRPHPPGSDAVGPTGKRFALVIEQLRSKARSPVQGARRLPRIAWFKWAASRIHGVITRDEGWGAAVSFPASAASARTWARSSSCRALRPRCDVVQRTARS